LYQENIYFSWLNRLATPFIDLVAIISYSTLLPLLVSIFKQQQVSSVFIVTGGYFLMCLGIFIGKKLASWPQPMQKREAGGKNNGCVLVLAWPYAIFVIVMIFDASGAFIPGSDLGNRLDNLVRGSTFTLLLVLFLFLIILVLFPLLLLMKSRPKIKYNRLSHILLRLFSVSAIDMMALITAAYWEWQLADSEPMQISIAGKILVFILVYIVFLMFYAPPRLALISLEPGRWSFAGYAFFLAYILWGFMG